MTKGPATALRPGEVSVECAGLTKDFGRLRAVDQLSFAIAPGRVTGFLGPNGAGKTTTLRMLLGLITPSSGSATIAGRRYHDLATPMRTVGAALEASSFHPGRSARDHLLMLAPAAGVEAQRCTDVLVQVGLNEVADKRVGGFSLGMRQRLALAAAMLGDPQVLVLDEPANGLDPEGMAWLRSLLRYLAGEGRTVLISSHVLSEVEQTVDDVVIIARGRLVHRSTLAELEALSVPQIVVESPDVAGLNHLVADLGWQLVNGGRPASGDRAGDAPRPGRLRLTGVSAAQVGAAAHRAGIELHQLTTRQQSLESIFLRLTEGQESMR